MTSTIAPSDADTDTGERGFPFRSSISTQPAPMTVSRNPSKPTKASLDVLISNDDFTEIACESLTIEFNVADDDWNEDAASILTPVWKKVSWPKPELPPGWVEDTSDPRPGVFTFRPENKVVGPSDALRLHLDNIHVSTCKGITDVVISVKTPSGTKDVTHSIGKFPVGFTLENFRADDPIVENGRSTKLNWTVEGDDNAEYEFFVNGVKKELEGNRIEPPFDTGPLHTTTVYKIVAKHQVGQDWIPHSDSTVVQVHGGTITASSVLVNGDITASNALINRNITASNALVNGDITASEALIKRRITAPNAVVNGESAAICAIMTRPWWKEAKDRGFPIMNSSLDGTFKCYGPGLIVGELRIWGEAGREASIAAKLTCVEFKSGYRSADEMIPAEFPSIEVQASTGGTVRHARQHFIMPVLNEDTWRIEVRARPTQKKMPVSCRFEFNWVSLSRDNRPPDFL